jgi:hypothetical protein
MTQVVEHLCSKLETQGLILSTKEKKMQFLPDSFIFSYTLWFELGASHLQCMHSISWDTPIVLFV